MTLHFGADVVQEVEQSSTNWEIGDFIPGPSSPHVDMSLGEIFKCALLLMSVWMGRVHLMSRLAPFCVMAPVITVWIWVNVK